MNRSRFWVTPWCNGLYMTDSVTTLQVCVGDSCDTTAEEVEARANANVRETLEAYWPKLLEGSIDFLALPDQMQYAVAQRVYKWR